MAAGLRTLWPTKESRRSVHLRIGLTITLLGLYPCDYAYKNLYSHRYCGIRRSLYRARSA